MGHDPITHLSHAIKHASPKEKAVIAGVASAPLVAGVAAGAATMAGATAVGSGIAAATGAAAGTVGLASAGGSAIIGGLFGAGVVAAPVVVPIAAVGAIGYGIWRLCKKIAE
jgi:hypothetical protein